MKEIREREGKPHSEVATVEPNLTTILDELMRSFLPFITLLLSVSIAFSIINLTNNLT
jgi:hypothetical protein